MSASAAARKPAKFQTVNTDANGSRSRRAARLTQRIATFDDEARPISRASGRSAPNEPATTIIWRGCANGRRAAGEEKANERRSSIAASDPRRSAWVAANAGAGKTHTLANRVTRLLLAGAQPPNASCASPIPRPRRRRWPDACSISLATGRCCPTKSWREESSRSAPSSAARRICGKRAGLFAEALGNAGRAEDPDHPCLLPVCADRAFRWKRACRPRSACSTTSTARELMAEARARVLERAG